MAFINTIPAEEAEGDIKDIYENQLEKYGYLPNYAKVFCYRPEIFHLWADLLAGIRRNIDQRRFLLVTFAAARTLKSTSCSFAYGNMLRKYFSEDEFREIATDDGFSEENEGPLSDAEKAMMRFAQKVAADATSVTAGDVQALRDNGFADEEIFDIVAAVAGRAFFTKLLDGLGAMPDAAFANVNMDDTVKQALVVGRPIEQ